MRLCSDNALATATAKRGTYSTTGKSQLEAAAAATVATCNRQPALLLRAHLLPGQRRTKIWDTPYQLVCICAPRAIPAPAPTPTSTPASTPTAAASSAAAFAFKHFHLPLKRSCCRFIVFVFLLVALPLSCSSISLSLSPSLSHSIHPALLSTIIIIIISVVSTFVAAALNTKELAYCSGQLLFYHLPLRSPSSFCCCSLSSF